MFSKWQNFIFCELYSDNNSSLTTYNKLKEFTSAGKREITDLTEIYK